MIMSNTEIELIEAIRNSKDPLKTFEFALTIIFENLQKPAQFEQQAPVCQMASS